MLIIKYFLITLIIVEAVEVVEIEEVLKLVEVVKVMEEVEKENIFIKILLIQKFHNNTSKV